MIVASLYSGGKDSTFAILRAKEIGHKVACAITMHPLADDSPFFHFPNIRITRALAEAMQIPLLEFDIEENSKEAEIKALDGAIAIAISQYQIEGVLHGGISSDFQKKAFEALCDRHLLTPIAPLWQIDRLDYMKGLVEQGFQIIIVGVSAMGLGEEWLGKYLDEESISRLAALGEKHGFDLAFEGGEAETLVIDCPLYSKRLEIKNSHILWDGQRGIFEIRDVDLVEK